MAWLEVGAGLAVTDCSYIKDLEQTLGKYRESKMEEPKTCLLY